MRPGYCIQSQSGDGALVHSYSTRSAKAAARHYSTAIQAVTRMHPPGQVLVLRDEREITGQQLRELARSTA